MDREQEPYFRNLLYEGLEREGLKLPEKDDREKLVRCLDDALTLPFH